MRLCMAEWFETSQVHPQWGKCLSHLGASEGWASRLGLFTSADWRRRVQRG